MSYEIVEELEEARVWGKKRSRVRKAEQEIVSAAMELWKVRAATDFRPQMETGALGQLDIACSALESALVSFR